MVGRPVAALGIWLGTSFFVVLSCSSKPAGTSSDGGEGDAGSRDGAVRDDDAKAPGDAARDADAMTRAREGGSKDGATDAAAPTRDPLTQPFASTSIWNMPIGSDAKYVAATIAVATGTSLETDDDVIALTPTAPSTQIFTNTADWNPKESRCAAEGPLLFAAPMPASWVVPDPMASTPNSGLAVLLSDGRTIKQTQPFARCTASQPATSHYLFPDVDLYGTGIPGAHGGSGLSAIGGTIRLGELRPASGPPRHVLKLELFAADNYYNDGVQADCFRWPASNCDGYFDTAGDSLEYGGKNPSVRPGSLLALPSTLDIKKLGLTTKPAEDLAWTLQNYGAYLVDDTAWSAVALCVENGAAGSFEDQFEKDWGLSISTGGTTSAFAKDMAVIEAALSVVDNNAADAVGGGGTPLQPLAPPLPDAGAGD